MATQSKLAVILHADVVGSTTLVQIDERVAHERIGTAFRRLSSIVREYGGRVHELRGDALVGEFERVSDAVSAALAFQTANVRRKAIPDDEIQPRLRIGVSMGEVVIANHTVTGAGVILAQRLEQLADPGGVCLQSAAYETLPKRLPFQYESLGEQELKGFDEPVRAYAVTLKSGESVPTPEFTGNSTDSRSQRQRSLRFATAGLALLIVIVGALSLWKSWAPESKSVSVETMAFPLPEKPSIAVLPFNNMSNDPEQEYFVDGITEDLITDLSKISGLFVIARNSTFGYKGKSPDVRQVAKDLGIRYVLEGSVRRSGDELRINAKLIDATTGGHIWADRYDGSLLDVFELQDKVTKKIVAALAINLTSEEQNIRRTEETDNPEAYDAFLQGWEFYRRFSADDFAKAIPYFERAIQLDPDYGRAYAALASVYWESVRQGQSWTWKVVQDAQNHESFLVARDRAEKYATRAIKNPSPLAHRILSAMHWDYRQFNDAIAEAERAISLDPNDPDGYVALAWALIFNGNAQAALDAVERAMRLDPRRPGAYMYVLGMARFGLGQFESAVAALQRAHERNPENLVLNVPLAAAYASLDRLNDAQNTFKRYTEVWTSFTTTVDRIMGWWPFRQESDVRRFGSALVKAGLCCAEDLEAYIERLRRGGTLSRAKKIELGIAFSNNQIRKTALGPVLSVSVINSSMTRFTDQTSEQLRTTHR